MSLEKEGLGFRLSGRAVFQDGKYQKGVRAPLSAHSFNQDLLTPMCAQSWGGTRTHSEQEEGLCSQRCYWVGGQREL